MEKFEKSVIVPAPRLDFRDRFAIASIATLVGLIAGLLAVSVLGNLLQYAERQRVAHDRDVFQASAIHAWEQNDLIRMRERSLESQLVEMTETAGAYRSYGVYHDCVQQNLGIYQMEEVSRAYDRHFRSSELTRQCLAESAWYETHPIGTNPAHLNH